MASIDTFTKMCYTPIDSKYIKNLVLECNKMIQLISPENNSIISLKTPIQLEFESDIEANAQIPYWCTRKSNEFGVCSFPAPVHFSWESDEENNIFSLSDTIEFDHIIRRIGCTNQCDIYNLLLGKTYYWKVNDSEIRSFTVEMSTPRWLMVEGTWNVRDIGGYTNLDGKKIKQGMIYRGAELDGYAEGRVITDEGRRALREDLGIRFDLDLRSSGEVTKKQSPIGDDVKYVNIPSESYGEFIGWKSNTKKFIEFLTDRESYPMYIHCAVGADRTGSLILVICGLLRMTEKDLTEEYEQSTISFPDGNRTRHEWTFDAVLNQLKPYGDNFHDRIYNYLISCGITEEQINTIRKIMIED